jgi:hypothetical protein
VGDLLTALILLVVAVLAAVGGVRLGMLVAPSVGRLAGRDDDGPADGSPDTTEPPRAEEPRDDA